MVTNVPKEVITLNAADRRYVTRLAATFMYALTWIAQVRVTRDYCSV